MEVCGPRGRRLTQETPLRAVQRSVFCIDFSCTPLAPEVLRAFRELLHPSRPTHKLPAQASLALLDPWMERYGAMGGRGGRREPVAMMMSCAGSLSSVIQQPLCSLLTTHPCFHLQKKENRVFFKISPLAFSLPVLNANANVNTNTLIKNMWEENANLLFCNLPQGAHCYRNK